MAFSLPPSSNSRGVVFLRPDEATLLSYFPKPVINSIRIQYLIVVHYCSYVEDQIPFEWVDLYLFPLNGVRWLKQPQHYLHISTRNFLDSSDFVDPCYPSYHRDIDLIFISNLSQCKNVVQWLKSLVALAKRNASLTSLSIIPITSHSRKLLNKCKKVLASLPQELSANHSILFLERHPAAPLYPISYNIVRILLQRSRVLAHFSDAEGECRVITEALAAGCVVSAYKYMKGAALEPLNNENSSLFSDYKIATDAITDALTLSTGRTCDNRSLKLSYSKENSVPRLASYISSNFHGLSKPYLTERLFGINLKYALAGHDWTLPSQLHGKHYLGTIQDVKALRSYLSQDLEVNALLIVPQLKEYQVYVSSTMAAILRRSKGILARLLSKPLWKIMMITLEHINSKPLDS